MDEKERRNKIRSSIRDYYALQASPEREQLRAKPPSAKSDDPRVGSPTSSKQKTPLPGQELDMDSEDFSAAAYSTKILKDKSLKGLFELDTQLRRKARELDGELQSLVYDNYSKFIAATDTIRAMKSNVSDMDARLQTLSGNVERIDAVSTDIRGRLEEHRAKIDDVLAVNRMLQKIRFLVALPDALQKFYQGGRFSTAIKYWVAGDTILEKYKDFASFSTTHAECRDIAKKCHDALVKRIRTVDLEADKVEGMHDDIEAMRQARATTIDAPKVAEEAFVEEVLGALLHHAKEVLSSRIGVCFVEMEKAETEFTEKICAALSVQDTKPLDRINAIVSSGGRIDHKKVLETLRETFFSYKAHCLRAREVLVIDVPKNFYAQLEDDIIPVLSQAMTLI